MSQVKSGTTEQRALTVATIVATFVAFAASVAVVVALLLLIIPVTGTGLASGELLVPLALIVVGTIVGGWALRLRLSP